MLCAVVRHFSYFRTLCNLVVCLCVRGKQERVARSAEVKTSDGSLSLSLPNSMHLDLIFISSCRFSIHKFENRQTINMFLQQQQTHTHARRHTVAAVKLTPSNAC